MLARNRHGPWVRLVLMLSAMALFILGYQWGNRYQRPGAEPPRISGVLIRPPLAMPDLRLQDPLGHVFDREALSTGWTLLAVGDLSRASGQLAVQRLVDVHNRLADQAAPRGGLRLVLVATADTPDLSRDFDGLSPALHVLGGDAGQLARLREALGVADAEDQTLFVFGPGGQLLALLPESEDGAAMAEDLKALFAHASRPLPETP